MNFRISFEVIQLGKLNVLTIDQQDEAEKISNPGSWEHKELVNRVGNIKLKAYVFFASFDQRDKVVGGEGACAAIVALIAHWLLMNPGKMPTRLEFDQLITEGSVEWRKLCQDDTHRDFFPNRHFNVESIIKAQLRPLVVLQSCSRIGFFHPERFEHLKDAWSFDDVWKKSMNQPLRMCHVSTLCCGMSTSSS